MPSPFIVEHQDPKSEARTGRLTTLHGQVMTPVFCPVGTVGTVKGMTPEDLKTLGVEMILSNAYHLYLRPGHDLIRQLGGLHRFMGWSGPILTDSGGYQIHSLSGLCRTTDDGVTFRSHLDGSLHQFTPERAIEIQAALGSDIMMVLDECLPYPSPEANTAASVTRTSLWARRCKASFERWRGARAAEEMPWLFGIVQGGFSPKLRRRSVEELVSLGFPGYAVGGLSVGEPSELMLGILQSVLPLLPVDRPRYLMGVGRPEDLLEGVARGVDIFDCVMPTRHARTGELFTRMGTVVIKQARYRQDERPVDESCGCYACRRFSRAYLRHLFLSKEVLALRLNTLHNLHYYIDLMRQIREAVQAGCLIDFKNQFYTIQREGIA